MRCATMHISADNFCGQELIILERHMDGRFTGSSAGLMDLAGFEKPGFYRRKAFWSTEPFACILTRQMMVMSMSGDRGMHIGIIQTEKMSLYEYSQMCKKKLFLLV